MLTLSELIGDLKEATAQMKQAAIVDDWKLVERLQKRRTALIEQIQVQTQTEPLMPDHAEALAAIRKAEAGVTARAKVHRQKLAKALERREDGARPESLTPMQKAYGAVGPKK